MKENPAAASPDNPNFREHIMLNQMVDIVTKRDQKTGKLTRGRVRWILTSKPFHSRGIKVMLEDRTVGRVQNIVKEN
ncbi:MAG: YwbE family protein [Bacteroidia bacterium]